MLNEGKKPKVLARKKVIGLLLLSLGSTCLSSTNGLANSLYQIPHGKLGVHYITNDTTQEEGTSVNYNSLGIDGSTYTLSGNGTTLTTEFTGTDFNKGVLFVGYPQTGETTKDAVLNVLNGAAVHVGSTFNIGGLATMKGDSIVNVDHASLDGLLFTIGDSSDGYLNIKNGSIVRVLKTDVRGSGVFYGGGATLASASGVTTIDGIGSKLIVDGFLDVNYLGTGTINIKNGGTVESGDANLGAGGGLGYANLTGSGSLWNVDGSLNIGAEAKTLQKDGTNTITISSGAGMNVNDLSMGAASAGKLIIDGAGSFFNINATNIGIASYIGGDSDASLTIKNGGKFTTTADLVIGNSEAKTGSAVVIVDGDRSNLTANNIDLSSYSTADKASLTVSNGAGLVAKTIDIAAGSDSSAGLLIVTDKNSSLSANELTVGGKNAADAQLKINNGGTIVNLDEFAIIGGKDGAAGSLVEISGQGSQLSAKDLRAFGNYGTTQFNVTNGGLASFKSNLVTGNVAEGNANNTINIDGVDSSVTVSGDVVLSRLSGDTTLNISNGGALTATGSLYLTDLNNNSTATLNIGGDQNPAAPGNVNVSEIVFGQGNATINFNHNSNNYVFSTSLVMGDGATGDNAAINQKSGTTILTGNNAGFAGKVNITGGELDVQSELGGSITNSAILRIGDGKQSGAITGDVANNGSVIFDRADSYNYDGTISGNGSVTQHGSGTLILTGDNSYSGGTTIDSGTLQIGDGGDTGSITGNVTNNGTLAFDRAGVFKFAGDVSGKGLLSQDSDGTLILTGNVNQSARVSGNGTLQIGDGGSRGLVSGDIANQGQVVFDRNDDVTYSWQHHWSW